MATELFEPMRFTVDIESGLVTRPLRTMLNYGDANANRIVVKVVKKNGGVDLDGMSATGAFYRPGDGAQVPLTGSVEGDTVSVTLLDHCYTNEGQYEAEVKLTRGDVTRTILSITGYVHRAGSGAIVDVSGVVPSLDALLAQIQATKDAAEAANQAATAANTAAGKANDAAKAAEDVAQAVAGWENAEATVEMLPPRSEPVVNVETAEDGHRIIKMQLPIGDTGATPDITFEVSTGAPGTQVEIEQSGTPENPVIHLTIPRGDTGAVEGIDYYEGNPAPLGEASPGTANGLARGDHVHPMPSAADVGALPNNYINAYNDGNFSIGKTAADGSIFPIIGVMGDGLIFAHIGDGEFRNAVMVGDTVADSAKLGGKAPEYYIQPLNLLDNSDFRNPVNQRGSTSGTAEGWTYTIDRWQCGQVNWSIDRNGMTITPDSTTNEHLMQQQFADDMRQRYEGKKITMAVCMSNGTICVTSGTVAGKTGYWESCANSEYDTLRLAVLVSADGALLCQIHAKMSITLRWAALYEGEYTADDLPPYVPKGYAVELMASQYARKGLYFATLTASGWSSSAPYTQTVNVSDILAADTPIVDLDMTNATADTAADLQAAWACVGRIVTGNDEITAYCYEEKPTVDLPLNILVAR